MVYYHCSLGIEIVCPSNDLSINPIPGMEIVDLLESLQLHNTTYAGLQQKPGPHSHHPAALFSGRHQFPPLVPWTLVLWYPGFWYWGTLVPWYPGTVVLWYPGTGVLGAEAPTHQFLCQVCHHCSVLSMQVRRDQCTTVARRETGSPPSSSLPKSLPSLPQSGQSWLTITSVKRSDGL